MLAKREEQRILIKEEGEIRFGKWAGIIVGVVNGWPVECCRTFSVFRCVIVWTAQRF